MEIRIWRIVVSLIVAFTLFVAIALTMVAVSTPEWQVAELQQVSQIHYIGLYQKCVYASRQGPSSWPQWICTYILYGPEHQAQQNRINRLNNQIPGATEIDYNAYGGMESWRLATYMLLNVAAFFGFLSFVLVAIGVCLDVMRTMRCMKAMSGLSLAAVVFAIIFCFGGMATFAVQATQSENMYMMELTSYAIFQLGRSFYMGIAAAVIFAIALLIDIGSTTLFCITATPDRLEYRQQIPFSTGVGFIFRRKRKHPSAAEAGVETEASTAVPMITYSSSCRTMITPPNHNVESELNRKPSVHWYESEPATWTHPKFAHYPERISIDSNRTVDEY